MKAKSIKGKSLAEISKAIIESKTEAFNPTLAIVFLSMSQDRKAISKVLDEEGVSIFGVTTNGEFIDEVTEKGSVVIMLLDMNRDYFQIFLEEYPKKNYREIARGIAQQAKTKFSNPAFLIAGSNMETDAEQLLFGFEDVIGKDNNATLYKN